MIHHQRPLAIDAFRYGYDNWPTWFEDGLNEGRIRIMDSDDEYVIPGCFVEGERQQFCAFGDYLIQYPDGEIISLGRTRFEERFEPSSEMPLPRVPKNELRIDVPHLLHGAYGKRIEIEFYFVDGSCQPHFKTGLGRDRILRMKIADALYESESFQPMTEEQAVALAKSVIEEHLRSEIRIEI